MPRNKFRGYTTANSHPIVKQLHKIVEEKDITYNDLSDMTGYGVKSFYNMRRGLPPRIAMLTDILQVLGYRLEIVPNENAPTNSKA